jgi:hypothetical protein
MLLSILIGVLVCIFVFGAVVCIREREYGTLIFAAVMLGATAVLLWYDLAHTAAG